MSNVVPFDGTLYRKNYVPGEGPLPGNCSQGQLTMVGAQMLRDTGTWLRSQYDDFLPPAWDHKVMYARSTDIDRTYESAENLLQTLFPAGVAKADDDSNVDVINIWTVEKGYDFVDVAQNTPCPALRATCAAISESPEWTSHKQSLVPLLQKLASIFNLQSEPLPDIASWLEVLRARSAQGLPLLVDQDTYLAVEAGATWELQALYNNATVHQFTSGQLLQEIVSIFSQVQMQQLNRLFTLFSAHDTTVAPLLSALQVNWTMWPNYASNVVLELAEDESGDLYVTLYHDRQPTQMGGCAMNCPLNDFVTIASKSFMVNRNQLCQQGAGNSKYSMSHFPTADPEIQFLC